MAKIIQTSYAKLDDGSWGLRGANLTAGAVVVVVKRDGTTKTETVGRIVRFSGGATLATIARCATPRATRSVSSVRNTYRRRYGWDGVEGSSSYYTSGLYDEES